jgi:vesicle coat complex subunit
VSSTICQQRSLTSILQYPGNTSLGLLKNVCNLAPSAFSLNVAFSSTDVVRNLMKKMAPPLVTLLSAEPEIQYVALRNINLIVQKRPTILAHEIKVFFCKYNDPIYVKLEKLEIMIKLASDRNIDQVSSWKTRDLRKLCLRPSRHAM